MNQHCLWLMLNPSTADAFTDDATLLNIISRTQIWSGIKSDDVRGSATISQCGRYRYELRRWWQPQPFFNAPLLPALLNCTGLAVGNLYAYRATDPMELLTLPIEEAIGPDNDEYLRDLIAHAGAVICAWGNGPWNLRQMQAHSERARCILRMIEAVGKLPLMLDRTKLGMPRHPLYWPANRAPVPYRMECDA